MLEGVGADSQAALVEELGVGWGDGSCPGGAIRCGVEKGADGERG